MRLSIRFQMILVLNAFVISLAALLGWIAQDAAGQLVEERFVKEMVHSASGFLKDKSFPRSDAMMAYLRQLFDAEWISSEQESGRVIGSSLSGDLTETFRQEIGRIGESRLMSLGGRQYRVDWADTDSADSATGRPIRGRLYLLEPNDHFEEARAGARLKVARVIWPAVGVATLLAILLSISITGPIRRLAGEMDRLADSEGRQLAGHRRGTSRAPGEIAALTASFYRLLDRLDAARQQMAQNEQLATLGRVSLSVAHELRNPLSGIKMNVRVLKDRDELKDDQIGRAHV